MTTVHDLFSVHGYPPSYFLSCLPTSDIYLYIRTSLLTYMIIGGFSSSHLHIDVQLVAIHTLSPLEVVLFFSFFVLCFFCFGMYVGA